TRGIYGIKKCHDPVDAVADIVFVHGLTGNRESTWTDKESGVFWPAHLLKNDIPKTRIMTFGYDADVVHFWAMASQNSIGNHALKLVNSLAQIRERTETEDRPIIFVTHSLGGLVFEDAMLLSKNSAEPQIQSLLSSTAGVCFLGTPHCGASAANWATVLGSIVNVVKTTNTGLLNVLKPDSQVLARIQGDFHSMLRMSSAQGVTQLKITCFFEELPVRGVGEIVPKHSAILPGYNSIPIHANHMDMTKFPDDEDEGYLAVSTEIMRWVRAIQRGPKEPPA
ncbi:Alpha/Beta hydrolase protein, partial [Amylocarpus encephaloides]